MSWCKAVVDEVQTGQTSYVGGPTASVPSTSVSTASQATAYNNPTSVNYSSFGVYVMSNYTQQQPTSAWQYPQQPTVYSQHPSAVQYPQQPPAFQYAQQPAEQPQPYYNQPNEPQSLQAPNAPQYFKQPPVSQPSQQSSALQYPYQPTVIQNSVYQSPRYYGANVPAERPMATYASVTCLNPIVIPTLSHPNYHYTCRWQAHIFHNNNNKRLLLKLPPLLLLLTIAPLM